MLIIIAVFVLQVTLYSRTFKLTGCDEFTQNFLGKLGVRVNMPSKDPNDPYMTHRKAVRIIRNIKVLPVNAFEKINCL